MNELEAKVRCLELAASVSARTGDHSDEGIVNLATSLYNFTKAPLPNENPVETVDKPQRGRKPKSVDILS